MKKKIKKLITISSIIIFVFLLFFLKINKNINIENKNNNNNQIYYVDTLNKDKELTEYEKIVVEFYKKYFTDFYNNTTGSNSEYSSYQKNGSYQLDLDSRINLLNKFKIFSEDFYENEKTRFNKCNEVLKKLDPGVIKSYSGLPEDLVEGDECSFVYAYEWVGGQGEFLNTVDILNSKFIDKDTAKVNAVIGYKLEKNERIDFSFPILTLVRKNGSWKISSIVIKWEPELF